jgi:DNA polymerase
MQSETAIDSETDFERTFAEALSAVPEAHVDRDRFVPGVGPLDASLVLVGEAPGATEVEEGEPFVGQAGHQLDGALEAAGIDRGGVYVTNVVKVRPPNNRTPHVDEIEAWRPVLDAELDRVDPAVVVTLGNTATGALLDADEGITDLRGRRIEHGGRVVVPTFHPASIFYDEGKRADLEADLETALAAV